MSIPHPLYIGIAVDYNCPAKYGVYVHDGFWSWDFHEQKFCDEPICPENKECDIDQLHKEIIQYIKKYQVDNSCKIIMAGLANKGDERLKLLSKLLWKETDVTPCIINAHGQTMDEKACSVARKTSAFLSPSGIPGLVKINIGYRHEVECDANYRVVLATLDDYKQFCSENTWHELLTTSEQVKKSNKKIVFFNSTPQGGGVAIIRHSTIRLYKLLGIDAHWFVMKPNPEIFEITKKKFHNVLQGVAAPDVHLEEKDKLHWKRWCEANVSTYWSDDGPVAHADVLVIDDPQPSGMIPHLRKINPKAKIVYRSHIELRSDLIGKQGTEQHHVWNFLWENIKLCDIFVSHPVDKFIPYNVIESADSGNIQIKRMPAITDPIDGLKKPLDDYSLNYYHLLCNRLNLDQTGKTLNFTRPFFIQIARFDPSKGIPDLIDAYVAYRQFTDIKDYRLAIIPQLVITGHGSIDDPEGAVIYQQVIEKIKKLPKKLDNIKRDIHVVRVGPSDQLLNSMLSSAIVAFQLSHREGFEIKVSESLLKGIPIIAYKSGGIPLQVEDNIDGHLVEVGDINKVSNLMRQFTVDKNHVQKLSENAKKKNRDWVLTPMNNLQWNRIMIS